MPAVWPASLPQSAAVEPFAEEAPDLTIETEQEEGPVKIRKRFSSKPFVYKLTIKCRTKTQVGVDLYNLLNANPGLSYNETFTGTGETWLRPTSILLPRFARFNVTVDF